MAGAQKKLKMRCPFEGQGWLNAEGQHLIFNDLYC
jgi:hypothetical protein